MTIRFACRCGKKMKTTDDKIGKKVLCSACGSPVVVPSSNTESVERVVAPPTAAADSASELLRSTVAQQQKSRKTMTYDDLVEKPPPEYDTAATFRYYLLGFLLPFAAVIIVCFLIFGVSSSLLRSGLKLPRLAEVHGMIMLDGEPLEGADITFRPDPHSENGIQVSSSMARTDKEGRYRLQYLPGVFGCPLGDCTVQISARDDLGREIIPRQYRGNSSTTRRTVEAGTNPLDFNITSEPLPHAAAASVGPVEESEEAAEAEESAPIEENAPAEESAPAE